MILFHPITPRILREPKVLRIVESNGAKFRVLDGFRIGGNIIRAVGYSGVRFFADLWGHRLTLRAYWKSGQFKHWFLVINNLDYDVPFDEWELILFSRVFFTIGAAYSGYLAS